MTGDGGWGAGGTLSRSSPLCRCVIEMSRCQAGKRKDHKEEVAQTTNSQITKKKNKIKLIYGW